MKKIDFGRFFDDRRLLMLFSVLSATLMWFVVVYMIYTTSNQNIDGVPVEVTSAQLDALSVNGLKIVDGEIPRVTVKITGERLIIGGVKPSDISVVADLSGISSPGTYNNIALVGSDRFKKGFTVEKITPAVVTLKIDRPKTQKFAIKADVEGLQIPENYIGQETIINPREVTISGPEANVSRIDRCVVSAQFTEPLTESSTVESEIKLYDSEGNELSKELLTLDYETADITIPVLKQKAVPVRVEFLNLPEEFPLDELEYTLSQDTILVAGPPAVIDDYRELKLGYVNINEIKSGGYAETFEVSLPDGYLNVENVKSIDVIFNTQDMQQASYTVTNIYAINQPVNYDVKVNTSQITSVTMVGPSEVLETLSAKDLVAEIDISEREVTPGPFNLPVHISAPGKGLVWAVGSYTAVVTIQEK